MQDKKVINTFAITTKQGVIRNINHSTIMQPKTQFSGNPMNWFDDNKLLKKKENGGLRNMEFAKIYDAKINEELKKYEKLQWEMYYRTLLPERMQQFEQEYIGNSKDKEQAMKQHKAELMAKHAGRIQRLLNQKRERLTVECLGELIDRLETAQYEADQKDNEFNPEDYEELPVDEQRDSSCEDEVPTLASEIIADQDAEIKKLKEELLKARNDAKAFEENWQYVLDQRELLRAQLDIITFTLKFYDFGCLENVQNVVRAMYELQPPKEEDEQEGEHNEKV